MRSDCNHFIPLIVDLVNSKDARVALGSVCLSIAHFVNVCPSVECFHLAMETVPWKMYVCCVFTCENTSETNQTHDFHQFPLNFHQYARTLSDLIGIEIWRAFHVRFRCLRWIRNVERPDFVEQFSYAGAQPFIGRYVCSRHFCDNDYVDSSRPHLGSVLNPVFIFSE